MNEEREFLTQNLNLSAYLLATKSLEFIDVVPVEKRWNRVYFRFADPHDLSAKLELNMSSAEVSVTKFTAALKYLKTLMNATVDEQYGIRFGL